MELDPKKVDSLLDEYLANNLPDFNILILLLQKHENELSVSQLHKMHILFGNIYPKYRDQCILLMQNINISRKSLPSTKSLHRTIPVNRTYNRQVNNHLRSNTTTHNRVTPTVPPHNHMGIGSGNTMFMPNMTGGNSTETYRYLPNTANNHIVQGPVKKGG